MAAVRSDLADDVIAAIQSVVGAQPVALHEPPQPLSAERGRLVAEDRAGVGDHPVAGLGDAGCQLVAHRCT